MTMRYTPGQLRDALNLPKETFRYWKNELPVLSPQPGQRACFGPADLLATAIIKQVTDLGVPVGRLTAVAEIIFQECRRMSWLQLERLTLVLQIDSGIATFALDVKTPDSEPAISIPLAPLVESLRNHLLAEEAMPQRNLAFPPVSVARGARS